MIGKGIIDHSTATRWLKKFCLACKKFGDQARLSRLTTMDFEFELQATEANLVTITRRVSGELSILQSRIVRHPYDLCKILLKPLTYPNIIINECIGDFSMCTWNFKTSLLIRNKTCDGLILLDWKVAHNINPISSFLRGQIELYCKDKSRHFLVAILLFNHHHHHHHHLSWNLFRSTTVLCKSSTLYPVSAQS